MRRSAALRPALPRLYDSSDEIGFDAEDGEPLDAADTDPAVELESYIRELDPEAREAVTDLRRFFADVVDELEDAYADTQPFVRMRR